MTQNKSYNCKNICPVYLKNKISTENINSINIARIIKNANKNNKCIKSVNLNNTTQVNPSNF
tara:strand:- start:172 stop:357 length:186 start_codon:yes stop_codon:yes gene_type:complete